MIADSQEVYFSHRDHRRQSNTAHGGIALRCDTLFNQKPIDK